MLNFITGQLMNGSYLMSGSRAILDMSQEKDDSMENIIIYIMHKLAKCLNLDALIAYKLSIRPI